MYKRSQLLKKIKLAQYQVDQYEESKKLLRIYLDGHKKPSDMHPNESTRAARIYKRTQEDNDRFTETWRNIDLESNKLKTEIKKYTQMVMFAK